MALKGKTFLFINICFSAILIGILSPETSVSHQNNPKGNLFTQYDTAINYVKTLKRQEANLNDVPLPEIFLSSTRIVCINPHVGASSEWGNENNHPNAPQAYGFDVVTRFYLANHLIWKSQNKTIDRTPYSTDTLVFSGIDPPRLSFL